MLLDPENPRFLHLQLEHKRILTQDDLNREIWDEDATITLSKAVVREGILNPIVVLPQDRHFLVIDGNRRVVTVRRLIAEHAKPPKGVSLDEIQAYIIPAGTSKQEVEVLKGVLQMGQRPWGPFNDAAYTRRLRVLYKMEYEDIAASLQLSIKEVKERIQNYTLFEEYTKATKDTDTSRFSYFADAPRVVREWFMASHKDLKTYHELICPSSPKHKIRSVATAGGLRDFAKIIAVPDALKQLVDDADVSVEDALEIAREADLTLGAPFLNQIGTWAARLKSLNATQVKQLKSEPRIRLELGRLKDAAEDLLAKLRSK